MSWLGQVCHLRSDVGRRIISLYVVCPRLPENSPALLHPVTPVSPAPSSCLLLVSRSSAGVRLSRAPQLWPGPLPSVCGPCPCSRSSPVSAPASHRPRDPCAVPASPQQAENSTKHPLRKRAPFLQISVCGDIILPAPQAPQRGASLPRWSSLALSASSPVPASPSPRPCRPTCPTPSPPAYQPPPPPPATLPALWAAVTASDLQNHLQNGHCDDDWPFLVWPRVSENPGSCQHFSPPVFPGDAFRAQPQSLLPGGPLPRPPGRTPCFRPGFPIVLGAWPPAAPNAPVVPALGTADEGRVRLLCLASDTVATGSRSQFPAHPRRGPVSRPPPDVTPPPAQPSARALAPLPRPPPLSPRQPPSRAGPVRPVHCRRWSESRMACIARPRSGLK